MHGTVRSQSRFCIYSRSVALSLSTNACKLTTLRSRHTSRQVALRTSHLSNILVHRHQIQSVIRRCRRRYTRDAHTQLGLVSVPNTRQELAPSDTDVLEWSISTFSLLLWSRVCAVAYQAWVRPPDGFWMMMKQACSPYLRDMLFSLLLVPTLLAEHIINIF
jgi:hypothetical protein